MNKIYLCGMTGDRLKDITEATECYDFFNGLVFVEHNSKDGTKELLESRKKDGLIISRPYFKQHSHSQNEVLFSRHIKNGSWIFWIDSPERIQQKWLDIMKDQIKDAEASKIGAFCFSGRAYLWQYFDNQEFMSSPHWGIYGVKGKFISYGEENKDLYIKNTRKDNPNESFLMHPIKYFYVFNPSNEVQCMYSKYGQNIVNQQELMRQEFRLYCEQKLNLSLESLDDLIEYMNKINKKEILPDLYFLNFCDNCFRMTDLFRHKILGEDLIKDIVKNRYNWRLSYYLQTRDKEQLNLNYLGTISRYNKQFNIKDD